jgi:putative FmdB family regulatory protein
MTYAYKCRQCGHKFDGQAKMADPCPPCPQCGGETAKTYDWGSAPAVRFDGGGWAKDLYSKAGK